MIFNDLGNKKTKKVGHQKSRFFSFFLIVLTQKCDNFPQFNSVSKHTIYGKKKKILKRRKKIIFRKNIHPLQVCKVDKYLLTCGSTNQPWYRLICRISNISSSEVYSNSSTPVNFTFTSKPGLTFISYFFFL